MKISTHTALTFGSTTVKYSGRLRKHDYIVPILCSGNHTMNTDHLRKLRSNQPKVMMVSELDRGSGIEDLNRFEVAL